MNVFAKLTNRETEIAELFAWGASKKDVANQLYISERTVENHARRIYEKTECGKVNELSAWWFCTNFNISIDLSPLKRKTVSLCLLALILPQIYFNSYDVIRHKRARTRISNTRTFRPIRRNDTDFFTDLI